MFKNLGDVIPTKGLLSVVKNLISKDDSLPIQDKETALKLLEIDSIEMQEVTKRWQSDLASDSFLSKNVRPMTLIFFSVAYVVGWFLEYPLDSISGVITVIIGAYFGSRGLEKYKKISR